MGIAKIALSAVIMFVVPSLAHATLQSFDFDVDLSQPVNRYQTVYVTSAGTENSVTYQLSTKFLRKNVHMGYLSITELQNVKVVIKSRLNQSIESCLNPTLTDRAKFARVSLQIYHDSANTWYSSLGSQVIEIDGKMTQIVCVQDSKP